LQQLLRLGRGRRPDAVRPDAVLSAYAGIPQRAAEPGRLAALLADLRRRGVRDHPDLGLVHARPDPLSDQARAGRAEVQPRRVREGRWPRADQHELRVAPAGILLPGDDAGPAREPADLPVSLLLAAHDRADALARAGQFCRLRALVLRRGPPPRAL